MSRQTQHAPKYQSDIEGVPFNSAEEAWFWFVSAQMARADGARIAAGVSLITRPCEPVDIFKAMERLYRSRRLLMDHILVLRHYGRRLMSPDPRRAKEIRAHKLWCEALERLEDVFVSKGIVAAKQKNEWWKIEEKEYA